MDAAILFLSHNHLIIDGVIVGTSILATRFRQFAILFIGIRLFLEILRHYIRTHPTGKAVAKTSKVDEKLDEVLPEPLSCLSSGIQTTNHTPLG